MVYDFYHILKKYGLKINKHSLYKKKKSKRALFFGIRHWFVCNYLNCINKQDDTKHSKITCEVAGRFISSQGKCQHSEDQGNKKDATKEAETAAHDGSDETY